MTAQLQPLIVSGKEGTRLPPGIPPTQPIIWRARGLLLDVARNEPIRFVRWANLATGEFEAFRSDPKETNRLARCLRQAALHALIYRDTVQLRWIPTVNLAAVAPPPAKPEPAPAVPADTARPHRVGDMPAAGEPVWRPVKAERVVAVAGRTCQHYACFRWADWMVSEEVERPPEVTAAGAFERAEHRRTRFWCDFHYQPPTLWDAKGELIQTQEVEARPQ